MIRNENMVRFNNKNTKPKFFKEAFCGIGDLYIR